MSNNVLSNIVVANMMKLLRVLAPMSVLSACGGPANLREFLDSESPGYVKTCQQSASDHDVAVNDFTYLRPQLHARVWPLTLRPDSDKMVSEQVFFDAIRDGKLKNVLLQARGGIGKTELSKALAAETCASLPAFRVDLVELYGAQNAEGRNVQASGANLLVDAVGKQLHVAAGAPRETMEKLLAEGRWLLIADSLDEVPIQRRPSVLDALADLRRRFPLVQLVILARPSVFDDRYGLTTTDAVLELPPLDCGRARSSLTRLTEDKDEATRVSNFAHDWKLDRQSTLETQCYFPFMATYRDLEVVRKLAKDFATDERLTNMSQVHEAIISERLQKELGELKWSGDKVLATVDALVAHGGWVDGSWNLTLTLPRCLEAVGAVTGNGADNPKNREVCERLFQSVLFERIQGAQEWKFGHQMVADLFVARWLEAELAKTPGKCELLETPASMLHDKEHREIATYLVSRPHGSRCLATITKLLCTANGGASGLAPQLSRGLPVGNARIEVTAAAKEAEAAKGDKADQCVVQVLGQLRK